MVFGFVGFYLADSTNHAVVTGVSPLAPIGKPTQIGHPMIGAGPGALPASSDISLSCPVTKCLESLNWGGFGVFNTSFLVTKVTGSWTVPTIVGSTSTVCPDSQKTWDSNAVWIGIDGLETPTVEQTGTSSDCFYGQTSYYAWYEFYPSPSVALTMTINPGDQMSASVSYVGLNATGVPTFTTTITDVTTSATYTSAVTPVPGALRESAEWVDESPYYDGFLGLTHVTQVKFTGATATINGATRTMIGWGAYDLYWLVMVDYNFPYDATISYVKAEPVSLNKGGNAFNVDWLSSGP